MSNQESANYFYELNIYSLKEYAKDLAGLYNRDYDIIKRIILYKDNLIQSVERKYILVFEITEAENNDSDFNEYIEVTKNVLNTRWPTALIDKNSLKSFYIQDPPDQPFLEWEIFLKNSRDKNQHNWNQDKKLLLYESGGFKKEQKVKKSNKYSNHVAPIKIGDSVHWANVKIIFISDYEILVQYGEKSASRQFNNAGFENRKNGKPIQAWTIFCAAASNKNRCIPFKFKTRKTVEKVAQELNKKLLALFPDMRKQPVQLTKEKTAYHFAFQLESKT